MRIFFSFSNARRYSFVSAPAAFFARCSLQEVPRTFPAFPLPETALPHHRLKEFPFRYIFSRSEQYFFAHHLVKKLTPASFIYLFKNLSSRCPASFCPIVTARIRFSPYRLIANKSALIRAVRSVSSSVLSPAADAFSSSSSRFKYFGSSLKSGYVPPKADSA